MDWFALLTQLIGTIAIYIFVWGVVCSIIIAIIDAVFFWRWQF
ncbi:hypothetical protein ACFL2R_04210 [Patescibacteria group bacterium]